MVLVTKTNNNANTLKKMLINGCFNMDFRQELFKTALL